MHANPTATGAGVAGTAGARIGCVTVDFQPGDGDAAHPDRVPVFSADRRR